MISVEKYPIPSCYYVTKINEHSLIKKKVLKEIDALNDNTTNSISKYDYGSGDNKDKPYSIILWGLFEKYMDAIAKQMHYNGCKIHNLWYQQYTKGNKHGWHVHQLCTFTNVYFLELQDSEYATEFYNIVDDKIVKNHFVAEGDLITFPSMIWHRSPVNTSDNRKTIISFNSDFY